MIKTNFETSDLGLAATLMCLNGIEYFDLKQTNNKKEFIFIFTSDKGLCEKYEEKYLLDKIEVKARFYFDNIRALKSLMNSKKYNY